MADEVVGGVAKRRRAQADDAAGVMEVEPGRWALPGVDLDTFFAMRRTPPEHRAGLRALAREHDRGALKKRHLTEWDNLLRALASAPLK
jgi:hypothetical protein